MVHVGQFNTHYPYPNQFKKSSQDYFCYGGERVVKSLSEALIDCGVEVGVYTSSRSGPFSVSDVQKGVQVDRYGSVATIRFTKIAPLLLLNPLRDEIDIAHAHDTTPPGVLSAYLYSLYNDVPLVITHHGGEDFETGEGMLRQVLLEGYYRTLYSRILDHAERIVVPSRGYIAESEPLQSRSKKVIEIPNGVHYQRFVMEGAKEQLIQMFDISEDAFIFLFLGVQTPRKGPDVFLKAFTQLAEQHEDIVAIIAGSGPLEEKLQRSAADAGLSSRVHFPGFIREEEKAKYFAGADAFVCPSTKPASDMYPLVFLEAAAGGTPILYTSFRSLDAVLREKPFAFSVHPDDVGNLASVMEQSKERITQNPSLADSAKEFARDHNWVQIAGKYEKLYANLV